MTIYNSEGQLEQTHKLDLTWNIDTDTSDTTTLLRLPAGIQFRGDWILKVNVKAPQHIRLALKWKQDAFQGTSRECDPPSATFSAVDADEVTLHIICNPYWAKAVSFEYGISTEIAPERLQKVGRRRPGFDPTNHRRFRVTYTITGLAPAVVDTKRTARVIANRVTFAKSEQDEGSGATKVDSSALREGSAAAEDSDDETDEILKQSSPPSLEDDADDGDFTYREIEIMETAYSTYRALLLYLHSGHITFAPLSCTFLPHLSTAPQTRQTYVEDNLTALPTLPAPVSPKSIYRLAHLLEIPSLLVLSLAAFQERLNVENAAHELFSETSMLYPEVQAVVLEFVVAKWKGVKLSAGMAEIERRAEAGELPQAASIFVKLMRLVSN